ncbi:hypothetical protein BRC81_05000 [Halobacteriales archaeon QS_1_68_20]|nr:MAG: hypothetical protein BRC81_05000 [Halobacteriales archaeon QS_1_68_20]
MAGETASTRGRATVVAVVAVLLVGTAAAWGLFVYDPAPTDPQRPAFLSAPDEPLPAPTESGPYQVTATMQSNYPDSDRVLRTKVYYPDGSPVVKETTLRDGDGSVVKETTYRRGDREFVMATVDSPSAFDRQVASDEVVQADPASLTYYEVDQETGPAADIEPGQALQGLYLLRYEERGKTTYQGTQVVRYEAVDGWTTSAAIGDGEDAQSVYVRQARGEVLVDADTGAILKADVSGSVIKADKWADVMVEDSYSVTVTYEVDTSVEPPSEPPWVDSLERGNVTATGDELRGPNGR